MADTWRLQVPASSANLGPGFDSLGLGLSPHLICKFRRSPELRITARGRDAALISCAADNLIWQTALLIASRAGLPLPSVALDIENNIPLGKGLGSSAAALTAGVVIADQLLQLSWDRARILDEAARLEGHPDNVAACVLGSIVASALNIDGSARAVRLAVPPNITTAVIVPDFALPTKQARAVLPEQYSRADAVFNIQRSALLIGALATGDLSVFPAVLEDRLHQPYRAKLIPGLAEILALRLPGLLGCCLSGAGPSVLAFCHTGHTHVARNIVDIFRAHGTHAEILPSQLDHDGYTLNEI